MGFFIRKSKKLGLINLNLSKSGLGFSIGVKGCRLSFNKKGVQLNAGRGGLYYRKSLNSKKQKTPNPQKEELDVQNEEYTQKQEAKELRKITKSPEQENFEFGLSVFTMLFIVGFVGLFFKFIFACLLIIIIAITRNLFIKRNLDKYEIYKQDPTPQCYYLGHFKGQIEELKRQANEQNKRIDEQKGAINEQ